MKRTVGVFLFNHTGHLLLQLRDPNVPEGGKYGLWGGEIEPGDYRDDRNAPPVYGDGDWAAAKRAARRELKEELGLDPDDLERFHEVGRHVISPTRSLPTPGGDGDEFEEFLLAAVVDLKQTLLHVFEGQGYAWFKFHDDAEPLLNEPGAESRPWRVPPLAFGAEKWLSKIVFFP